MDAIGDPKGVKINLFGTFSVTGPDGSDLTPKSMKGQGLLALLATSKNHHKRTRAWLQDKLWSQKSSEKGSTSLRQELRNIRKKFAEHSTILHSDRNVVWLDKNCIQTDFNEPWKVDSGTFLEGIDIDDLEFEHWLSGVRSQTSGSCERLTTAIPRQSNARRWKATLVRSDTSSTLAQFIEAEFVSLLMRSLAEFGIADVSEATPDPLDPYCFEISVSASPIDNANCGFRASVLHRSSKRVLWSDTRALPFDIGQLEANLPLITLVHMVQSAVAREISFSAETSLDVDARALVLGKSTPRIFSFDVDQLDKVDKTLQQITDGPERAVALGWRTQISVIKDIEQLSLSPDETAEEGLCLAAQALEANSMNSLVLSSTANAHVFLNWDIDTGAELAKLAIRVNPSNPLAWWSYANVALYREKSEEALKSARIASQLAENSQLRFWCKFQLGLAALQIGDIELAKRSLEASAAVAPNFRPPRRYLLALYSREKQFDRARQMTESLKKIEPGFSVQRFFCDEEYPISLARKLNLVDPRSIDDLA